MSYNVLSEKQTRRYARLLSLPLEHVITRGGGGHLFQFRTIYHQHGIFCRCECMVEEHRQKTIDAKGKHWAIFWLPPNPLISMHWSTCRERFPEDFEGYPPWRYIGPRGSDWLTNGV